MRVSFGVLGPVVAWDDAGAPVDLQALSSPRLTRTREQLLKELVQIHEQMKRSALYVTHNISEAVLLSDRVVVMRAHPGEVAAIIDVDLPRPRQLSQLSEPGTVALMDRIRDLLHVPEGENA